MAFPRGVQRVRGGRVIRYAIGTSGQSLVFEDAVIEHLKAHRQRRWLQPEAGGQLFARFDGNDAVVVEATGPRPTDRRSPMSYGPDRCAEREEIAERHSRGLHFIGDWHTHPERRPAPSSPDCWSIGDCVRRSSHSLNGFVIVVVGTANPPDGLYVAIHDGRASYRLGVADQIDLGAGAKLGRGPSASPPSSD